MRLGVERRERMLSRISLGRMRRDMGVLVMVMGMLMVLVMVLVLVGESGVEK